MTYICVSKLIIFGSDNGLSHSQRQAIIWTNAGILFIVSLGTNVSEILVEIHIISFKKMHLKMLSTKFWSFCLGLNVLTRSRTSLNSRLAGISVLGPNSVRRGSNQSIPETCEHARVLVKKIGSRDTIFSLVNSTYQSGTKPNLVAKILATKIGVIFVICVMFSKICSVLV